MELGCDGTVPASANFAPRRQVELFEAYEAGDYARAVALLPSLLAVTDVFRVPGSFHSAIKEAMGLLGLTSATAARQPALPLTADGRARLREVLERAQLLQHPVEA
jgi:4-hydroxy-tetrahydrodipicolinate synthase